MIAMMLANKKSTQKAKMFLLLDAIASVLEDMQGFQLIVNFLLMPLFFLSGALFPLNGLPKALAIVASIDPLSYGVDGLRGSLTNGFHFGLGLDLLVLSVITMIVLAIGSYLFQKFKFNIKQKRARGLFFFGIFKISKIS